MDIVRKPMDFKIINERLDTYQSFNDFAADVNQIFENCFLYNPPEKSYEVCALASGLQHYFRKACKAIKKFISDEDTKEITAAPPKMPTESPNEDLMSMFEESPSPSPTQMLLNYDFDPIVVKNSQTAIFELLAANTCVCIIVRDALASSLCEVLSFIIS